ncbi:Tm-1-like ATP-binding domain-containing protein [Streptomyces ardesiacus]|uniref:Tm-1-like ATP-binding domain-containing protein n=1 Tax=Streptomyces ardesiacus TaxID=285564 RepID=UPI00201F5CD0|nr:Tm-1-like ATP-binding domain-containing protein [Streptomyces ardesiacus]MCL7364280.1 Tm-1-like ATP-binding domain-containing protein [Streptomyces ardesiacus]
MATVVLLGTLDTKGAEYAWLAERLRGHGVDVVTVDVGPLSDAAADVTAAEVARAAGADLAALRAAGDRGRAMEAMAAGAARTVTGLHAAGRLDGVLAVGGSGGTSVASRAVQELPVGVPKLLVSTMAAGDVTPYVGAVDVTLMYAVVDVAGINSLSEQVFGNAAAGVSAMAREYARRRAAPAAGHRPLVGLSMFGLTTPAVDEAREELDRLGYEPLVFHATGAGGRTLEKLAGDGRFAGVLDLTTTELADDLVGGVLSAGPRRLEAAGARGVPQVVSPGALDMVNFGPRATVPARFDDRTFVVHNPTVTLMRTTPAENAELGRRIGAKLAAARGPVTVFLPLRGVSGVDRDGGPFRDAEADAALFAALREALAGSAVEVVEDDAHINDPGFGRRAAHRLHELITAGR